MKKIALLAACVSFSLFSAPVKDEHNALQGLRALSLGTVARSEVMNAIASDGQALARQERLRADARDIKDSIGVLQHSQAPVVIKVTRLKNIASRCRFKAGLTQVFSMPLSRKFNELARRADRAISAVERNQTGANAQQPQHAARALFQG